MVVAWDRQQTSQSFGLGQYLERMYGLARRAGSSARSSCTGDQATVVEASPRWGGARYWEMIELAVGVDMARACAMAMRYGKLPVPCPAPDR